MGGNWKSAVKRTWKEASEAVGLGTRDRVAAALLIQALIAVGIFVWGTNPDDAMLGRGLTAAAPFAVFPILFVWKWVTLPPTLISEAGKTSDEEQARRRAAIFAGTTPLRIQIAQALMDAVASVNFRTNKLPTYWSALASLSSKMRLLEGVSHVDHIDAVLFRLQLAFVAYHYKPSPERAEMDPIALAYSFGAIAEKYAEAIKFDLLAEPDLAQQALEVAQSLEQDLIAKGGDIFVHHIIGEDGNGGFKVTLSVDQDAGTPGQLASLWPHERHPD
jgi:hypothetical protein